MMVPKLLLGSESLTSAGKGISGHQINVPPYTATIATRTCYSASYLELPILILCTKLPYTHTHAHISTSKL